MVKTHPFLAGELYEPLQFLTLFVRKLHDLVDQSYPMVNPFSIIFPSLLLEQVLTFGKKSLQSDAMAPSRSPTSTPTGPFRAPPLPPWLGTWWQLLLGFPMDGRKIATNSTIHGFNIV